MGFILGALVGATIYVYADKPNVDPTPHVFQTREACVLTIAVMRPTLPAEAKFQCVEADGLEIEDLQPVSPRVSV